MIEMIKYYWEHYFSPSTTNRPCEVWFRIYIFASIVLSLVMIYNVVLV